MGQEHITAVFADGDQLTAALGGLRAAGAVTRCSGLTAQTRGATLHLTVSRENAALARCILRRAGGRL